MLQEIFHSFSAAQWFILFSNLEKSKIISIESKRNLENNLKNDKTNSWKSSTEYWKISKNRKESSNDTNEIFSLQSNQIVFKDLSGIYWLKIPKNRSRISSIAISQLNAVIRDGRLAVGDEIINVNGRRLRGISLQEARLILQNAAKDVDIVIARSSDSTRPAQRPPMSRSPLPPPRQATPSPPRQQRRSVSTYKKNNRVLSFSFKYIYLIVSIWMNKLSKVCQDHFEISKESWYVFMNRSAKWYARISKHR